MRRFIPLLLAALPAFANLIPGAEIDGFGTTVITGSAFAEYPSPLSVNTSNTAITDGSGLGFLIINGGGGGESGGGSASIGPYSWNCTDSGCITSGFTFGKALPFTLGIPFQVDISASAFAVESGTGTANFTFSAYEAVIQGSNAFPGESVTITDPPSVPEPATILLFGGGLALLAVTRRIRRA